MVLCAWAPEASITVRCIDDVSCSDPSLLKPVIAEVVPSLGTACAVLAERFSTVEAVASFRPLCPLRYLQVSA